VTLQKEGELCAPLLLIMMKLISRIFCWLLTAHTHTHTRSH